MNQTKLTKWIEQAEERAVCELAKAEPDLVKLSVTLSDAHRTATKMRVTGFISGWRHRLGAVDRMRSAA